MKIVNSNEVLVIVCGSRTWTDESAIRDRLGKLPHNTVIMHGACPYGADEIADRVAWELGFLVRQEPADWKREGKRAGFARNLRMLKSEPDLVLAFHMDESKGTAHTITNAQKLGIPVEVYSM